VICSNFNPAANKAKEYATMQDSTTNTKVLPLSESRDVLTAILRDGAQRMLTQAIEAEVSDWIERHADQRDEGGRRQVVRNGHLPTRKLMTGLGEMEVRQPRVHDRRRGEQAEKFTSKILPPYLRKTKTIEELIPWLYLKGISTGDMSEALAALVGAEADGLSASTVTRLKGVWETDFKAWNQRSLEGKPYVYIWADGVHFNIRLEEDRQCILVLMGATADGQKELIALAAGLRESEQSWRTLLLDCQARGLVLDPKVAVGDGGLGFWKALPHVWPTTRPQRCWVHKTVNVLDKLPKSQQPQAKGKLHDIYLAATRVEAEKAFDLFLKTYEGKYPKATECLAKDRVELLTFYDFPAEHWVHLRTTNPIESVFASVRLRTYKTRGHGSALACETMVFKLMESAAKRWRLLNSSKLLPEVIAGVKFIDGEKEIAA
jgi:transposase-like protein